MTSIEAAVWERILSLIERFRRADRIVVGSPMWNFGIPYKLKQLIDLVAQRRYLFSYDGKSYGPELHIVKGIAVYTRGSRYVEGTPLPPSRYGHQASYLGFWLDLVGVEAVRSVVVDNAWNQDGAVSACSIAEGRARLLENVTWFIAPK